MTLGKARTEDVEQAKLTSYSKLTYESCCEVRKEPNDEFELASATILPCRNLSPLYIDSLIC